MSEQERPSVTVGVVARERFSVAAESLRLLFQHTHVDFELIYVDSATPRRYWAQIERELSGHENVRVIHSEEPLLPNQAKELIAEASSTELTCLLENDVFVTDGWLSKLVDAMRIRSADVVMPMIYENSFGDTHGDKNLGYFNFRETAEGTRLEFLPIDTVERGKEELPLIDVAEVHCLLFRTEVLQRLRPFREPLTTREFVDTSLTLHRAGARLVFQPASEVVFMSPPPVERDEMRFFLAKWDLERAAWTHERIGRKWNLVGFPNSMSFVRERRHRISQRQLSWYRLRRRIVRRAKRTLRGLVIAPVQILSRGASRAG